MKKTAVFLSLFVWFWALAAPAQIAGRHRKIFPSAGGVTWTLVQGTAAAAYNFTCAAAACATGTLTSTTATNLEIELIAAFSGGVAPLTSYAISGDTMTECSGFPHQYAYNGSSNEILDCWYKLSATGGATTFTATPTWGGSASGQAQDINFVEAHRSTGTATVDSQNFVTYGVAGSGGSNCATCAAPALTITGTSDFCVQWGGFEQIPTAIGGSYSNLGGFDNTNVYGAFTYNNAITSYSAPNWTVSTSSGVIVGVVCFK